MRAHSIDLRRFSVLAPVLAFALGLVLASCSNSNGGAGGKDAGSSTAGKGSKAGTGGKGGTGGTGGKGAAGKGSPDAGKVDSGGPNDEDSGATGGGCTDAKKGCYTCEPKAAEDFLNHCTDSQCQAFDNVKRLPASFAPGKDLPPIP